MKNVKMVEKKNTMLVLVILASGSASLSLSLSLSLPPSLSLPLSLSLSLSLAPSLSLSLAIPPSPSPPPSPFRFPARHIGATQPVQCPGVTVQYPLSITRSIVEATVASLLKEQLLHNESPPSPDPSTAALGCVLLYPSRDSRLNCPILAQVASLASTASWNPQTFISFAQF